MALGPIVEEIIFRGSFQSVLGRWMPRGIALVLIAMLFGAVHGVGPHGYDLASEIQVGTAGVWYGVLFELSGSLLPAIVAHATWNAIAMCQALTGKDAGLPLLLFGVLASAALMVRNGSRLVSA